MRGLEKQVQLLRKDSNEKSHELHNIEHLIGLKVCHDYQLPHLLLEFLDFRWKSDCGKVVSLPSLTL